ncbi:MAG: glycosyltransferase family 4 protein [Calditrichaeota bacterium]|nr:glycosyltransferase family 4 protein [Calditrichota bacterium]
MGGYDTANIPQIGYGHQRGGIKKQVSRFNMTNATVLTVNSNYIKSEIEANAGISSGKIRVVYHGVEDSVREIQFPKKPIVLTVGKVDRSNLRRKGHELFVKTARHLPHFQFVLIGRWHDDAIEYLKSIATPNVEFTGWVSNEELWRYYSEASVYFQPSLHEGFGLSVAESMLAGCIPVVSTMGALPEVVGPWDYYMRNFDPLHCAELIVNAHQAPFAQRIGARNRVLEKFTLEKRKTALHSIIDDLLAKTRSMEEYYG